jgi:hypothetical protein
MDLGDRPAVGGGFGDDHVRLCFGGYLGEVGDGQDLVTLAEFTKFAPTAVAVSPPIPASTSSKMYVAPGSMRSWARRMEA